MHENTAPSRQHASRLADGSDSNTTCNDQVSQHAPPLVERATHPTTGFDDAAQAASQGAATGEERGRKGQLLTVHEVAELLQVPTSWVYQRTRRRSSEQLPHLKLGKYLRFEEAAVAEFVRRQRCA